MPSQVPSEQKEKLRESGRVKLMGAGIISDALIAALPLTGLDIPTEVVQALLVVVTFLYGVMIYARTQRSR